MADLVNVYGTIKRETAKAVLFLVRSGGDAQAESLVGKRIWCPRSVCNVQARGMGPMDVVGIPAWLVAKKVSGD